MAEAKPADHLFEVFRQAAKKIISVPRAELLRREVKYQQARKNKNRKRHR